MNTPVKAYGDGRVWDEHQVETTRDILSGLQAALAANNLGDLRGEALYLMDVLFPTGFVYDVNHGPSEDVHGGYMAGRKDG